MLIAVYGPVGFPFFRCSASHLRAVSRVTFGPKGRNLAFGPIFPLVILLPSLRVCCDPPYARSFFHAKMSYRVVSRFLCFLSIDSPSIDYIQHSKEG